MNISIFEIVGPVMIGPSSSHTAGAARLARVARAIAAKPFVRVSFGLHGSFAKTYKGHGTDRALVAGALGLREDDERLANAFSLAEEQGFVYDFYETVLEDMHENSVVITFTFSTGETSEVIGSSIGGAQIVIRRVNGFETDFNALLPTLLIRHKDQKGVISDITCILAENGLNIGTMKLSRKAKGDVAFCFIETDNLISDSVINHISSISNVLSVQAVNIKEGEE